jgi:membrane-associated phospholipid phosphatase
VTAPVAVAAACVVSFALLGWWVAPRAPMRVDAQTVAWRGEARGLAVFFTRLGRWYAIVGLSALAVASAWLLHARPVAVVELFVVQVLGQGCTNALKVAFHRPRPDDWLHRFERGFSYPSGHAVTAVVFFVGLIAIVRAWHPVPHWTMEAIVAVLAACVAGVPWSRISLGAHYFTDVAGGLLLGTAWLLIALVVAARLGAPLAG